MTHRSIARIVSFYALLLLGLGGCGMFAGDKEQRPEPAVVRLTVLAANDLNPDVDGRPSPLVVRIYTLESKGVFAGADFLSLYRDDQATLGKTLFERQELTLMPGQAQQIVYTLPDKALYIGVAAQYQRLEETQWRAVLKLPAHRTTKAILHLERARASFTIVH